MPTQRRVVVLLRLSLVVLFGILLLLQTFSFPGQFAYMAEQSPDTASLRWPLAADRTGRVLAAVHRGARRVQCA